jgi:hypothetical protein
MANRLGVGLIEIDVKGNKCKEILTAQHHEPIKNLFLCAVEVLGWNKCTFCGEVFKHKEDWTRKSITFAADSKKTFYHIISKKDIFYTKRQEKERYPIYLCPDCISEFNSLQQ